MDTIRQTNVHYIRCIKPNEAKVEWVFESNIVLSQLRACGVLETIRISCAGYPTRWTFDEFSERYHALIDSSYWYPKENPDVKNICSVILDTHIKDTDKYQIGLTKIFFRAGQVRYIKNGYKQEKKRKTLIPTISIACLYGKTKNRSLK
jgi:myosin-5